jgi:hypothetical protein
MGLRSFVWIVGSRSSVRVDGDRVCQGRDGSQEGVAVQGLLPLGALAGIVGGAQGPPTTPVGPLRKCRTCLAGREPENRRTDSLAGTSYVIPLHDFHTNDRSALLIVQLGGPK